MRVLLVSGSRYLSRVERDFVARSLTEAVELAAQFDRPFDCAVVGDASGVDYLATAELSRLVRVERFKAEWALLGKAAGPARNGRMVARAIELSRIPLRPPTVHQAQSTHAPRDVPVLLAFPRDSSVGTRDMIRRCDRAGFDVRVFGLDAVTA